jgi:hypothetical protein
MQNPSDYVDEYRRLLADLGCEPVVIGALAALQYRTTPRFTTDIDVLVRSLRGVADAAIQRGMIASILAAGNEFDEPYVSSWANDWAVGERWSEAQRRWLPPAARPTATT